MDNRNPIFTSGGHQIPAKSSMRYLGVQLDTKLNLGAHVRLVTEAARRTVFAFGRLTPNIQGPSEYCIGDDCLICRWSTAKCYTHSRSGRGRGQRQFGIEHPSAMPKKRVSFEIYHYHILTY